MDDRPRLGVIGGSGVYAMEGLEDIEELVIETPFGAPSSAILVGKLGGRRLAFLARHGVGHVLLPSEVNYRANIYALKLLGVERVLAISACGSLRVDYAPGDIVIPDQLYDHTHARPRSFFGEGLVAHVSAPEPFCPQLNRQLADAVLNAGGKVHLGGTSVTIEGPRFSTRAESNIFRAWGMSIVGMTTAPEAFLAREAELCYAVMAHVTDYDVWHLAEAPVSVEMVLATSQANTRLAKDAIGELAGADLGDRNCTCPEALRDAFLTHRRAIPPETLARLRPIVGRYLD
jgi:5'-methylthioadenosine phosphorylase